MADLEVARQIVRVLEGSDERGGRAALATVIRRSGSAPQVVGAQLLLHADGSQVGTIGGGRHRVTDGPGIKPPRG